MLDNQYNEDIWCHEARRSRQGLQVMRNPVEPAEQDGDHSNFCVVFEVYHIAFSDNPVNSGLYLV